MAKRRYRLTPQLIKDLGERIKAGAFEHVASESLGIPFEVYQQWLARGQLPRASSLYRELHEIIQQARAHARLMAEMQMRADNPRTWLLHGPGKETAAAPGWSSSPKAAANQAAANQLQAEILALIAAVYEALKPYPEARLVVAQAVEKFQFREDQSP